MTGTETKSVECDVLVVGGGFAGCCAALRAKDFAPRVVLVEKGKVSRGGASPLSGCFVLCPTDKDDLKPWMKEIVERGDYMADQDWVEVFLVDLVQRIKELDSWGPLLEKDKKGNFNRFVGRANVATRMAVLDALHTIETMRQMLEAKGVTILDRTMITDLLTGDGCHPTTTGVAGAVGFNTRTAELMTIKARAVIIATGGTEIGVDVSGGSGDGVAQAFRAGAEITGMEFANWWGRWTFEKKFKAGHLNMYQALNWKLTNARGERFMEKYSPELKERGRIQDLTRAFGTEYVEGRGPISADFRHCTAEELEWARNSAAQGHIMRAFDAAGLDFSQRTLRFDLCPGFLSFTGSCGISTNTFCETTIKGLYAAGQAGAYPTHGVYSVGGVNITMCFVMGYRAGEFAAKYVREIPGENIQADQVKSLYDAATRPLRIEKGVKATQVRDWIGEFLSLPRMGFFRHEKRLAEGLAQIAKWEAALSELRAEEPHELMQANGVRNYLECCKLSFLASRERKESRGGNLREDYPYMDNINYLKWFPLRRAGEGVSVRTVPIPMYRYPIKPQRYDKVPVSIPKIETG